MFEVVTICCGNSNQHSPDLKKYPELQELLQNGYRVISVTPGASAQGTECFFCVVLHK
jgi:regulator of replication initiation timing